LKPVRAISPLAPLFIYRYISLYVLFRKTRIGPVAPPKGQGKSKGKLIDLGEPLQASLDAFCEAHYGAPQVRIIREAVRAFIEAALATEPELRKRYDAARERVLEDVGGNVRVLDVRSKMT
jgi:hypothetical protein